MSSAISVPWITLIAAIGIGTIIASVVGWWSAKAVAISNHRQNWINALRDDLVTYLKEIDSVHYRMNKLLKNSEVPGTSDDSEKLQETRTAALLVYRRILLRLNMTERLHVQLAQNLKDLLIVKDNTADDQRIDAVVTLSRQVLKNEWAVTKYGIFTKPIVSMKTSLKQMDSLPLPCWLVCSGKDGGNWRYFGFWSL